VTHTHTHKYCLTGSFLRRSETVSAFFLCQMLQLPSSSVLTTLHIVHHEFVLLSLMWTLIYIQWITFLCK
jgi:hypothetical protein